MYLAIRFLAKPLWNRWNCWLDLHHLLALTTNKKIIIVLMASQKKNNACIFSGKLFFISHHHLKKNRIYLELLFLKNQVIFVFTFKNDLVQKLPFYFLCNYFCFSWNRASLLFICAQVVTDTNGCQQYTANVLPAVMNSISFVWRRACLS